MNYGCRNITTLQIFLHFYLFIQIMSSQINDLLEKKKKKKDFDHFWNF